MQPNRLCSNPACRYRALYEGSQTSLADMAHQQAEALSRVGRLRNGIITTLRRSFSKAFTDAESSMGHRMNTVDDELLLVYMAALLAQAPGALEDLRNALVESGIGVPEGNDMAAWAAAVRSTKSPAQPQAPSRPVQPLRPSAPVQPQRPRPESLGALFEDAANDQTINVPAAVPSAQPRRTLLSLSREAKALDASASLADLFSETATELEDLSNLFDDESHPSPQPTAASRRRKKRRPASPSSGADAVLTPSPVSQPWSPRPEPQEPEPDPLPTDDLDEWPDAEPHDQASPWEGDWDALVPESTRVDPEPQPVQSALPEPVRAADDHPRLEPEPVQQAAAAPLRPGLFPAAPKTTRRRPVRTVRTQAAPPDSPQADLQPDEEGATGLTERTRQALLAAVCIPRPIFTSDLVSVAGSDELVAAWEAECRASTDSGVRFIAAKTRHQRRGSLVLPGDDLREAATEFKRTTWAEAMERYRGGRLYEIGVLLHRIGEEVVSARLGEHTMTLRLNQRTGLVGIVVVLETRLGDGETTRAALGADLDELLGERLTLVSVLTPNAEVFDSMCTAVTDEAGKRRWSPPMPVVAARSWEYADNRGSTAQVLLGG